MKRPTFKDPALQNTFEREGYVVVDLLSETQVADLKGEIERLNALKNGSGFSAETGYKLSFFSDNKEFRRQLFSVLGTLCQPFLDRFLIDHEPLMVNLFDKEPASGEVPVHQNWTFVEESVYRSVSLWIPLVDVNRENGTMEIVPRSHVGVSDQRGPRIPWAFVPMIDVLKQKYMMPLNLKVGQAAIIDDAILHYTSQNDTEEVRSTVQVIAKPKEAMAIHYHRPNDHAEHLEVFEVSSDFFHDFNMNTRPESVPKLAEIAYRVTPLDEERLRIIIG